MRRMLRHMSFGNWPCDTSLENRSRKSLKKYTLNWVLDVQTRVVDQWMNYNKILVE